MVKRRAVPDPRLDDVFNALADPSRRAMVERLSRGSASVSDLADPLPISLPAALQHVHVLERSGLVRSEKVGRIRRVTMEPRALSPVEQWVAERRRNWKHRLDRLGQFLAEEESD